MLKTQIRFGTFPLSTDGIADAQKITAWRDAIGRLMRLEVDALPDMAFNIDMTMRILPGLAIVSGNYLPFRIARTRELLLDGDDDIVLLLRTGPGVLRQGDREIAVAAGESVMISNADCGGFTFTSPASLLALVLPRLPLSNLLRDLDGMLANPLPHNDALRLLEAYLSAMGNHATLANPELRRNAVLHIYDLVALAFDGKRDAAAAAEKPTLRAVRLRAIKTDIAESLDRGSGLSVGEIAARQRVSARYIQMLFDGEGTTFTQFVLRERLARAHRLLTDPSLPDRGIAAVAYAAGFGDLSYFIRAFRREFGATPSQIRSGALHQACRPGSLCA